MELITVKEKAKVAIAAQIGSVIDWYDLFIVGLVAAIVWQKTYFQFVSGPVAIGLALLSYAIVYVSRPLGAIIFGHYGDKLGRKTMLIATLVISGGSMFGMAFVPTYSEIGIVAPFLIYLFRLLFGLGIGGEIGGAQTWVSEFAYQSKYRGFWNGVVISALSIGAGLASILAYLFITIYGNEAFISFAWRYLFIIGGIVIIAGILIRYFTLESPIFTKLKMDGLIPKLPIAEAFKYHWKQILSLILVVVPGLLMYTTVSGGPLPLQIGSIYKIPSTIILLAQAIGAFVGALACIIGGYLSDLIGRKKVYAIGMIASAIVTYPAFILIFTGNLTLLIIEQILATSTWIFTYGAFMALLTETFPARIRYTGSGLTYQLSTFLGGIIIGFLIPYIISLENGLVNAWPYIAIINIISAILATLTILLFAKETKEKRML